MSLYSMSLVTRSLRSPCEVYRAATDLGHGADTSAFALDETNGALKKPAVVRRCSTRPLAPSISAGRINRTRSCIDHEHHRNGPNDEPWQGVHPDGGPEARKDRSDGTGLIPIAVRDRRLSREEPLPAA